MDLPECPEQTPVDVALGTFLLVGTLVSFLPQHIRLFMRKSHVGLSLGRVILGAGTGTASVTYFIALGSYESFICCTSTYQCYANSLSFCGVAVALLCDVGILALFMIYFDHGWLAKHVPDDHGKLWRRTKIFSTLLFMYQAALFGTVIGLVIGRGHDSDAAHLAGSILIGVTTVGQILQWAPQIYETHKLQHVGSLSIPMVFLQAIGSALTAIFNAGMYEDQWYMWVPFVCSCTLASILAIQTSYYWYRDRKNHVPDVLEDDADITTIEKSEKSPLLINSARSGP